MGPALNRWIPGYRIRNAVLADCDPWNPSLEYAAGDKIFYELDDETHWVANRFVYESTPPLTSDGEWFWSPINSSECPDPGDPDDVSARDFLDQLTPEGSQIAVDLIPGPFDPDAQAIAEAFVQNFDQTLTSGGYEPFLSSTPAAISDLPGGVSVGASGQAQYAMRLPVLPGHTDLTPTFGFAL